MVSKYYISFKNGIIFIILIYSILKTELDYHP